MGIRPTTNPVNRLSAIKVFAFAICSVLLFSATNTFATTTKNVIRKQLSALTKKYDGRLGVYAFNTANDDIIAYNPNQRFPLCSTSKIMIVAAILKNSMQNLSLLNQFIHYNKSTVLKSGYAPVTEQHIRTGMSIKSLCAAAVSYSDNVAANLLMQKYRFYLVRWEPQLNTAIPGDKRDTSTAKVMSQSLKKLILGDVLAKRQRQLLARWLIESTTGNARIRRGVPKYWIVGDKTGTGNYGTTNDIAVIWPPKCRPIILSIYYTQSTNNAKPNEKLLSKVARDLVKSFAQRDTCLAREST